MANIAGYILASVIILALSPLGIVLAGSVGLSLANSIPLSILLNIMHKYTDEQKKTVLCLFNPFLYMHKVAFNYIF